MLPKAPLPDITFTMFTTGFGKVGWLDLLALQVSSEQHFDPSNMPRVILVIVRQCPSEMHMVGQNGSSDNFEGGLALCLPHDLAETVDVVGMLKYKGTVIGDPSKKDGAAWNVDATVVGHTGVGCDLFKVPGVSISIGGRCPPTQGC